MKEIKMFREKISPIKIQDYATTTNRSQKIVLESLKLKSQDSKKNIASINMDDESPKTQKKRSKWALVRALKNVQSINVNLFHARKLSQDFDEEELEYEFSPQRTKKPRPIFLGTNDKNSSSSKIRKNRYSEEKSSRNGFTKAIDELRLQNAFHSLVASNKKDTIKTLQGYVLQSISAYSRDSNDPKHILSKRDKYGRSSLDIACQHGHLPIVKYLIDNGCNFEKKFDKNSKREIPLIIAIRWNHPYIVDYQLSLSEYNNIELNYFHKFAKSEFCKDIIRNYIRKKGYTVTEYDCKCYCLCKIKKSTSHKKVQPIKSVKKFDIEKNSQKDKKISYSKKELDISLEMGLNKQSDK